MISLTAVTEGKGPNRSRPVASFAQWTGEALPEAKVVRRELARVPKIEVVGLPKEKVEELLWDTVTQVRADLAGVPEEMISAIPFVEWK